MLVPGRGRMAGVGRVLPVARVGIALVAAARDGSMMLGSESAPAEKSAREMREYFIFVCVCLFWSWILEL